VCVRLSSATYQEPGFTVPFLKGLSAEASATGSNTIAPRAPANLPLHFGDINLGAKDKAPVGSPLLKWKVVGDWPTFRTLLAQATEKDERTAGRAVKSLRLILMYKNRKGQPVSTETVDLPLTSSQGTVRLRNTGPLHQLGSIAITPLSVDWQERLVRIPLSN
jgi:hypothetical protein